MRKYSDKSFIKGYVLSLVFIAGIGPFYSCGDTAMVEELESKTAELAAQNTELNKKIAELSKEAQEMVKQDTPGGPAVKLTYSNFFPPTHIQSILAEEWCNEVEKRTDGRVKVQYFPGGTLTKAPQCYDGVVTGQSDIGFGVFTYTRDRFPIMSAVDLPLGYPSGKAATQLANAVYEKYMPEELMDTQVMYLHGHGPGIIHTKDKAVMTVEDMKGLKLRATGTSAKVVEALGAVPVPKPMSEVYQMLQKGVVEGGAYPFESAKGWKLGEVTDYATADFSAAYTTAFFVVMNKDKWSTLSEDIQAIIKEVNSEWIMKHGEAWDGSDMAGISYFLTRGGQIVGLDSKEAERWRQAVAPISDEYAEELTEKGFNGREIIDFMINTLREISG